MKRLVILFLAVLLAVSGLLTVGLMLGSTQEQVTHQETVLMGDPSAADGLQLSLRYLGVRDHPQWLTEYSFGEPDSSETDFHFYTVIPVRRYPASDYRGLVLNSLGDYFSTDHLSDLYLMEVRNGNTGTLPGLLGAYQQLYLDTPEGGLTNTYLRIRDYCEYYPLSGTMELPNGGYMWNAYATSGHLMQGMESADSFSAYFRIPVLEDDWMQVVVDKRTGSTLESVDVTENRKGSDVFRMSSVGVCFENTAYFTFNPLTEQGNVVDTSLIPGGYGLYSFVFNNQGTVDLSSLSTRCPLDPSYAPYDMTVDAENRNLLYFSVKDGVRYLTVIALDTMELLQTLPILENEEGWQFHKLLDNGLVAVSEETGISVWEKNDRGLFESRFTVALEGTEKAFDLYDGQYAFDGQRLAVLQQNESAGSTYQTSCGFRLRVYSKDGCDYHGAYEASLQTDWIHTNCRLYQVEISW